METKQKALNLLISAVRVATLKGAYTLEEAEILAQAVRELTKEEEKVAEKKDK